MERPEYKWYYSIPFTRGRKDYIKDREVYEAQFLTPSKKVANSIDKWIEGLSVLLITIITSLWSLLPPLTELPTWLDWTKMGMTEFGAENWGNQIMLTLIPGASGAVIHKAPKLLPHRNARIVANCVVKCVPVIVLLISAYLPIQGKKYFKLKKGETIAEQAKFIQPNETIQTK